MKFAVGTMMLSIVGVGGASEVSQGMLRQAERAAHDAERAMRKAQKSEAIGHAERAVLYSPTNAGNRALLGQAYLQSGRFASAETAFTDALRLDASHGRAALGLALAQIALGKSDQALAALEQAHGRIPDADYGLGLALAGDREHAIAVLEAAARSTASTAKTRQNLALAFALSGRWAEARATAAQDITPELVDQRMTEWARFSRPVGTADQVASLLGVRPVQDPGLPTRLALLDAQPAQPSYDAPQQVAVEAPAIAEATPTPAPLIAQTAVPASSVAEPEQAKPMFVVPQPQPVAEAPMLVAPVQVEQPRVVARPVQAAVEMAQPIVTKGNFVVQLGAFSSEQRLAAAWDRAVKRATWLGGYDPFSTTLSAASDGRTLYRLSVSGFESRLEAASICRRIRDRGGECFVRGVAGDAPVQWVNRKSSRQYASR